MSKIKPIETEFLQSLVIIKFVHPEMKNPLSINTLKILNETFGQLNSDKDIETIIFTGSGNTFAAGANLNEVASLNEKTAVEFGIRGQNLMQTIYSSEKQTIAAIDGFCMGGALDLALSCNLRFASPRSVFAHPGAKLGIITGWSGTQILPRLVGKKNAIEIFLTAKKINADEALRIGLVDEICNDPLAKAIEEFGE